MIDFVAIPEERMELLKEKLSFYNRKLANFFDVRISTNDDVEIDGGNSLEVARAKEIVTAFGRGFEFEDALDLVDESYVLEIVNTKEFSGKSRKRRVELKGRVIGRDGRSKDVIEKYSGAKIVVYGKTVGIIGKWDSVRLAKEAVEMLLAGAKHTSVFKLLEEKRVV